MNFFWNKKSSQSVATAPVLFNSSEERRRAFRFKTTQIKSTLKLAGREIEPMVLDMSTLGIGLELDFNPPTEPVSLIFHTPGVLRGTEIELVKRHVSEITEEGKTKYRIGYEYVFSNYQQQTLLLRWFAQNLREAIPQHEESRKHSTSSSFHASFYTHYFGRLDFQLPSSSFQYDQCLKMIPQPLVHHTLMQTKFFMACQSTRVLAFIPFACDSDLFKLPADKIFPEALDALRSPEKKIGEVLIPYFREDILALKNPSVIHFRKLSIMYGLFPYLVCYAKNFSQLSDLIVAAPTHMEEFFRMWLFKPVNSSSELTNSFETRGGFCLMRLCMKDLERKLATEREELFQSYEKIAASPEFLNIFNEIYFPDGPMLQKWFLEQNQILQKLSAPQKSHFRTLIPGLTL